MDGLILAFKIYMFTWIFSPLSLLWRHWLSKSCYDIIDYQNLKHHSMYFVLTQRGWKIWILNYRKQMVLQCFLFTWHMYALLFLQLWHMIVLLIILIMAWWYHFWHIKFVKVSIYFIISSEINAYLQWIKVIFSQVKWYCINSQVSDTIYVFTVAKIWKFLAQMHFKMFGKWEASWKWCYWHWRVLTFLPT